MSLQDKLIKLFIGLVLFATMVWLTVTNVPNTGRILDLCYGALIGLGVLHLGAPSTPTDTAPAKEGGFSSVGFLATLAIMACCLMTGCATPPTTQQMQTAYVQACAAYNTAFSTALMLREADRLTLTQIQHITLIDSQVTPICTGPLPPDLNAATIQITAAVTSLAILESTK